MCEQLRHYAIEGVQLRSEAAWVGNEMIASSVHSVYLYITTLFNEIDESLCVLDRQRLRDSSAELGKPRRSGEYERGKGESVLERRRLLVPPVHNCNSFLQPLLAVLADAVEGGHPRIGPDHSQLET